MIIFQNYQMWQQSSDSKFSILLLDNNCNPSAF